MKPSILALTLVSASLTASAQQPPPPNPARFIHRIEARLGITPEQVTELKAILHQEKPTLEALHIQLAAEHAELAALTTFNQSQTEAIIAKYAPTNTAQLVEREKLRCEIYAILTPAQQQKLEQLQSHLGAAIDNHLQTLGENL
jgi:Spy/CpxP family protein refolding chaperone